MHSRVSKPPEYVVHTPVLFSQWEDWASGFYESGTETGEIKPLGQKIYPSWIRMNFSGLEDFFQHYIMQIEEFKELSDAS